MTGFVRGESQLPLLYIASRPIRSVMSFSWPLTHSDGSKTKNIEFLSKMCEVEVHVCYGFM